MTAIDELLQHFRAPTLCVMLDDLRNQALDDVSPDVLEKTRVITAAVKAQLSHCTAFTIDNIPHGLRALARTLIARDNIDAHSAWHDVIAPAIDDLKARLSDEYSDDPASDDFADFIDEADFMSEHFGLEPDYFIALLNHVA